MFKTKILHIKSINIASIAKQFQSNNETKDVILVAQVCIT
jgi:hypothetical protein